jgi:hypothetical protein
MAARPTNPAGDELPEAVKRLFWDQDPDALRWERDRQAILGRILSAGSWDAVSWVRQRAGDSALRDWIEQHRGRGLSPQQLRYWQLILDIPARRVSAWLREEARQVWDHRARP